MKPVDLPAQPADTMGATSREMAVSRQSWWLLVFLVLVHACNWMDRYLASILIEPMKRDLALSDTQIGIITGVGFSVIYSLAALPFARLADRGARKPLLSALIGAWSAATMLASAAVGFLSLAATRLVVAAAESGCSPTAYSLISDSFPSAFRGRAISLYALGVPLGAWAGLTIGGIVNDHVGWRATYLIIGAPGLLLALLAFAWMKEPARGQFDAPAARSKTFSFAQAMRTMGGSPAFILSCISIGLLAITTSSFQGWAPTYLMRSRELSSSAVGSITGTFAGLGGVLALLIVGVLADVLGRRDARWYLWLPLAGALVLLPAEQLFLRTDGYVSYAFYFLTVVAGGTYVAPLFTLSQILLPPGIRAVGSAVMLLVINLVGMGGGIFAAGALSDVFQASGSSDSLAAALQVLQVGAFLGIFTLAGAAYFVRRDIAALQA